VKTIRADVLALVRDTHGFAELTWTQSIPLQNDPEFPVLQLPETKLEYATTRGYPIKLEPRKAEGHAQPLLFVQIESFDVATHGDAGWAIPAKYKPETDEEVIAHELGFDEGWEDARVECIFICDERFAVFWRAALDRKRFGLTVAGVQSLYPVALGEREREPLQKVLKKWRSK
jgi:hypothetical protein